MTGMKKKLTIGFIMEQLDKIEGFELLSKEYIDAHQKLTFKCSKGHEFGMRWNNFQQGQRCSVCAGNKKLTIGFIKEQIEAVEGYKLLSTVYVNNCTKMNIRCDKGHEYEADWVNFQSGKRCPVCIGKVSKAEIEIQEFVKTITDNVICNDRTQLVNPLTGCNLELDVYIPDKKKAIEYNGTYWHSFDDKKILDKIKRQQCEKLGIELLVVNEELYMDNKDNELKKVKDFII